MSVLHIVLALDSRCAEWLDAEGVSHPGPAASNRMPTPREVRNTLTQLPCHKVSIDCNKKSGNWLALIEHADPSNPAWAALRITDYRSEDDPHEISFRKGFPEVIFLVVERLTRLCGPLIVVDDSSIQPTLVCAGDTVQMLLDNYEATL